MVQLLVYSLLLCMYVSYDECMEIRYVVVTGNDTSSCVTSKFGCCLDGVTHAKGPEFSGCPGNITSTSPHVVSDHDVHGLCYSYT